MADEQEEMMTEEEEESVVVAWSGIWVTLIVSVVQGLAFYWFFLKQRSKDKEKNSYDLFEPRQHERAHRSPAPFQDSWIKEAWARSQEETLRCVGLDSFMFLRFLRLGARMSLLGTVLSFILIPVYATGDAEGDSTTKFNQWTLARVEADSARLWASLLCWWIFLAFVLYELWNEWKLYAVNRSHFLARGDEDIAKDFKYAIRVEQIPQQYRTNAKLKEYFQRLFPGKVRDATIYLKAQELQRLIDERQAVLVNMEKTEAFTIAKPENPRPQVKVNAKMGCCGGEKVDALEHYAKELERLNGEVDTMRAEILAIDIEEEATEEPPVSPDESVEVDIEADSSPDKTTDEPEEKQGLASSTGVVTFTSLRAKQAAVQCEMSGRTDTFTIVPAPDPKGILWNNISTPEPRQRIFQFQAGLFWSVGIVFWALPVSFVTGVANLNSLLETFGLGQADESSFWYGLVSGLLPVIFLAILMAVLYMAIVAAATHFVKYKSMAEVDAYAFYWHMLYQFANLWLILIGGSAINQIDAIIEDIGSIVEILATALPGASVFFVNMIIVGSFGQFGLELSMIPQYGLTLVMNIIQPEAMRTQRMLDDAKKAPFIEWARDIPPVVFIFFVMILYMPIVPVMEVFAFAFFSGSYLVWKHQCLHVYAQESEGGGEATWLRLFGFLMACIYMSEFVFIAYMGIKEAPAQAACGIVPVVITIIMHQTLKRNVIAPLENLSLEVAADVDLADGELDEQADGDEDIYGQPALNADLDEREPMPYRREKDLEEVPTMEESK